MFSNNEEKKLDWMYKGPNALVDREDYLLGRTVDKTLEQLNDEEKNKTSNPILPTPKNHVEHECIPPSIRDYNKVVQSEQVDLQAKLQEDPLMLIKRQEDETRRQFLQNPIQLKKLQEAMQAQLSNKKKRKKHKGENDVDKKLRKKLKMLNKQLNIKDGYKNLRINDEMLDDEAILDTILMHKFNSLKSKLSEDDLRNIVLGNFSDGEQSDSDKKGKETYFKSLNLNEKSLDKSTYKKDKPDLLKTRSPERYKAKKEFKNIDTRRKGESDKARKNKLSEEEKEAMRKSMMQNAAQRSKESASSYKIYRKEQDKPETLTHHGDEFIRKELLKSTNSSTVADRIKANVNNIQRSKSSMNSNFLK